MLELTSKSYLSKNIAIEESLAFLILTLKVDLLFDYFLFYKDSLSKILALQNSIFRILSILDLLDARKSREESWSLHKIFVVFKLVEIATELNLSIFFFTRLFDVLFDYNNFSIDNFSLIEQSIADFIANSTIIKIDKSKSRLLFYNKEILDNLNSKKIVEKDFDYSSRDATILFDK